MEDVFYNSAVKLAWQANRRFWEEDTAIYGGISFIEHEIEQIWYPCYGYHGHKGVLLGAYSVYEAGDSLGSALPLKRAEIALEGATKLHPMIGEHVNSPISVAWQNMPYAIGCWAEWDQTQRGSSYQTLLKPDGPIYFAGEHISHLTGWQEGAILSAHHVVAELDANLSRIRSNGIKPGTSD